MSNQAHADVMARGERRTRIVVALTVVMMVLEIAGGIAYGSMALLADGWHMASHAAALSITLLAIVMVALIAYVRAAGDEEVRHG